MLSKMQLVHQKPVFCTECLRKRVAYTRRPFLAPNEYSVHQRPLSCTEFRKTTEKRRALTVHVPGTHNLYTRRPSLRSKRKGPERAKRAESSQKRLPLRNFELHKKRGRPFSSTSLTDLTLIAIICAGESCSARIKGQKSLSPGLSWVSVCLEDRSPTTGQADNST